MSDTRFLVQRYISEGWSVLPIPNGRKAPEVKDWVTRTFDVGDFQADDNIGIRLGEPSGHLVDVDLDCAEAVKAAPEIMLPTPRRHGRQSVGTSHYWYIAKGIEKSERWLDTDGKVLVELRSTGGQTVVPASTHPSGEKLFWIIDGQPSDLPGDPPPTVEAELLRLAARSTATAALLARHWPDGSRHVAARDVAGFLAARGLAAKEIEDIVRVAATIAGDDEIEDRARVARDTVSTFDAGGKTTGGPTLEASVGAEVVKLLIKWYGNNTAVFDGLVTEMNAHRFGARVGKDYVYGLETEHGVVFQPARSLFEEFANQRVKIGTKKVKGKDADGKETTSEVPTYRTKFEIWREHPKKRSYRTVGFWPPPLTCHEKDYNLWTGFAVKPLLPEDDSHRSSQDTLREWADQHAKAGCQLYLDMMFEVICGSNQEHYDYLLKWMAFTCQQPGIPIEVSVTMKGELGTGKGTFARIFGSMFGRHFTHLDRTEQLAGKFNAAISGKVVVFADEAFFAGDKKDLGSLKRLISEPTLAVERKGIDVVEENNCIHLIMATNNEHAHQASFKERRFFTIEVSSAHQQNHIYFNAINKQMREGGREALLSYLLTREVTHDDIRSVPMTDELRKQQEMSLTPEQRWWKERLIEGYLNDEPWPNDVSPNSLHAEYLRWCDDMKINRRVTNVDMARRVLKPWLGKDVRTRQADGTRSSRRSLLSLDQSREVFDKMAGTKTPWEEADGSLANDKTKGTTPKKELPF
jgi:hypothetical protein